MTSTESSEKDGLEADWFLCALDRQAFIDLVAMEGKRHYRELPWRNIADPYAVLVSEVMLQQTQVARVEHYWERWLRDFPSVDALAAADNAAVLEAWQGLGYNRRALALKKACEVCALENAGHLPKTVEELQKLPGIGPATAGGIVAFAFNHPSVYLETNVRSVFLHELFPEEEGVSDKQLIPYIADTCPSINPRQWYYALLDYGAHLKSQGINPNRRSKHYTRQSNFIGSHREKRSFLLKQVLASPEGIEETALSQALNEFEQAAGRDALPQEDFSALLDELLSEGFFQRKGSHLIP